MKSQYILVCFAPVLEDYHKDLDYFREERRTKNWSNKCLGQ